MVLFSSLSSFMGTLFGGFYLSRKKHLELKFIVLFMPYIMFGAQVIEIGDFLLTE